MTGQDTTAASVRQLTRYRRHALTAATPAACRPPARRRALEHVLPSVAAGLTLRDC